VLVFGISIDSVKSHKKFEEKYQLTFPLLSDEKKEVVQAYGVWGIKKFMGREYEGIRRSSFIVDPKGKIAYIFEDVKPEGHAEEVLGILSKISAS
jgi:peroxiredoxin Q/BCP